MARGTIPTSLWEDLCDAVETGTVVDRPYERIHFAQHIETGYGAFVEYPFSTRDRQPDPEPTADDGGVSDGHNGIPTTDSLSDNIDFDDIDEEMNERVSIPSELGNQLEEIFTEEVDAVVEADTFGKRFDSALISETEFVATFRYFDRLTGERADELVEQFNELMVTLGAVSSPDDVSHGTEVQPYHDDESDHPCDLGMSATVFELTPTPHEYISECDTLEEYIDMCVENGADRAELENRDLYFNHFHPQTTHRDLTERQEAALKEWEEELTDVVIDGITLLDTPVAQRFGEVSITESGTVEIEYSVSVGDDLKRIE